MIFYHYTHEWAIDGIRSTGVLKTTPKAIAPMPAWLNLTTDPDPSGHGLPDGRELVYGENMPCKEIAGRHYCYDYTEWRVGMDLNEGDSDLVKASTHHTAEFFEALEIAGYLPTGSNVPDPVFRATVEGIRTGNLPRKGATWWYYKKAIPVSQGLLLSTGFLQRR